jgi:hypothetical protein
MCYVHIFYNMLTSHHTTTGVTLVPLRVSQAAQALLLEQQGANKYASFFILFLVYICPCIGYPPQWITKYILLTSLGAPQLPGPSASSQGLAQHESQQPQEGEERPNSSPKNLFPIWLIYIQRCPVNFALFPLNLAMYVLLKHKSECC